MRKLAVTLSTVLIVIAAPVLVGAADLITPLIFVVNPEQIACTALNVSSHARSVTVFLRNQVGSELLGGTPMILDPGEGTGFAPILPGTNFVYCQFTVNGPKASIRAGALLKPGNTFHPAE